MRFRRVIVWLAATVLGTAALASAGDNPRIFITDSQSWEVGSGGVGINDVYGASGSGGARPQTAEIIKTFHQRCPNLIVNDRRGKADYIVVLDHEGGKSFFNRDNKIAVFNNTTGDAIFSRSTRSLGNAVKDACTAIYHDWSQHEAVEASNKQVDSQTKGDQQKQQPTADPQEQAASVTVKSEPAGADIEVDGNFVGNTPSQISLAAGDHKIVVRMNGYTDWERTLHVTGGKVNLVAVMRRE